MIDVTRELVAYSIIAIVATLGVVGTTIAMRRRRKAMLRRRGIKTFGH